jgi:DNA invertase Pin-like site-specific DNA recombinase
MREAIGYIRVSSEEQADSGLGLEAQRQRIKAYCALKELRLAELYEDAGISGGKPLASRPAGRQLLAAAKRGQAVIVVAKLDRLFRSVADAANVIADFDKKGIELVAIAEGFDLTSFYGRAMAQMASVFAELERAMIRVRTRSALRVKRSRGERISGHAPYGWDCFAQPLKSTHAAQQPSRCQSRSLHPSRARSSEHAGEGLAQDAGVRVAVTPALLVGLVAHQLVDQRMHEASMVRRNPRAEGLLGRAGAMQFLMLTR